MIEILSACFNFGGCLYEKGMVYDEMDTVTVMVLLNSEPQSHVYDEMYRLNMSKDLQVGRRN